MRAVRLSVVGVNNSPPVPLDLYQKPFNVSMAVEVTGDVTYSVQWTVDDIWNPAVVPVWFAAATNLTGATDNQAGSLESPVTAVRLSVTAGTGSAAFTVLQSGVMG